jgi:hypothetical protein
MMPVIHYPGPQRKPPGLVPGGILICVHAVSTDRTRHRHLFDRELTSEVSAIIEAIGDRERAFDSLLPDEDAVCVVIYDGDTGERIREAPWER